MQLSIWVKNCLLNQCWNLFRKTLMVNDSLILGFGSPVLSDEGIVPAILEKLEKTIGKEIDVVSELTLSLDLIKYFDRYKSIIIIDTYISKDDAVGALKVFTLDGYFPTLHLENIHDISLPDLFSVAMKLGYEVPQQIKIIAINIVDNETISCRLTKELKEGFEGLFVEVQEVVEEHFRAWNLTQSLQLN